MNRKSKPAAEPFDEAAVVSAIIRRCEFDWWRNRCTYGEAFQNAQREARRRISKKRFRDLLDAQCQWFKKVDFVKPAQGDTLSATEWERLRGAVFKHREAIRGVGIDVAVAIVSTTCRTNANQLRGLRTDVHFWLQDELLTAAEQSE